MSDKIQLFRLVTIPKDSSEKEQNLAYRTAFMVWLLTIFKVVDAGLTIALTTLPNYLDFVIAIAIPFSIMWCLRHGTKNSSITMLRSASLLCVVTGVFMFFSLYVIYRPCFSMEDCKDCQCDMIDMYVFIIYTVAGIQYLCTGIMITKLSRLYKVTALPITANVVVVED